ncbi:hypothetical protein PR048_031294 [Dryococelus australis]|uniref:Uncharacterized protein n=1 Tax=Dryococelus australis TaxID=614101 RepID=A0ABQ9G7R0_9NEOP|nr:hypothetical protein PR048_031294 [Dryococelus australis]
MKGREKPEIPEKIRQPAAQSSLVPLIIYPPSELFPRRRVQPSRGTQVRELPAVFRAYRPDFSAPALADLPQFHRAHIAFPELLPQFKLEICRRFVSRGTYTQLRRRLSLLTPIPQPRNSIRHAQVNSEAITHLRGSNLRLCNVVRGKTDYTLRQELHEQKAEARTWGSRLDSTVLFTLVSHMFVHWLLNHTVASVTTHLAVWHSLLLFLASLLLAESRPEHPRENPLTSSFVRHDSHMRKSGSDHAVHRTRFALVGGEQSNHYTIGTPDETKIMRSYCSINHHKTNKFVRGSQKSEHGRFARSLVVAEVYIPCTREKIAREIILVMNGRRGKLRQGSAVVLDGQKWRG